MSPIRTLVFTTAFTALIAGPSFAAPEANDAAGAAAAKISLTVATAEAEKHVQGKAVHAEFEKTGGQAVYEVEVTTGAKVFDVTVDADKGTVISSKEDGADGKEGDKDD